MSRRSAWIGPFLCVLVLLIGTGGCTARGRAEPLPPAPALPSPVYPVVSLPRDEAPHRDLTEWWYYTGHLQAADGRAWGFEFVVFQVLRGPLPPFYVSHFAVTDPGRRAFRFAERGTQGAQAQPPAGFALDIGGWTMAGLLGRDRLAARMEEYGLDLSLGSQRAPVLHDGGLVSFGPAGVSYYYSRTRMDVTGILEDHGDRVPVTGLAWCDRQWGNFLVLGGGWDWFSIQLDDGSDVMLNLIRDGQGVTQLAYGTYVEPSGEYRHLPQDQFEITPTGRWTSPRSGGTYPMGWRVALPEAGLALDVSPLLDDQELDTRQSTGNVYWEGATEVTGSRDGHPIRGRAYVEMTGYAQPSLEDPRTARPASPR